MQGVLVVGCQEEFDILTSVSAGPGDLGYSVLLLDRWEGEEGEEGPDEGEAGRGEANISTVEVHRLRGSQLAKYTRVVLLNPFSTLGAFGKAALQSWAEDTSARVGRTGGGELGSSWALSCLEMEPVASLGAEGNQSPFQFQHFPIMSKRGCSVLTRYFTRLVVDSEIRRLAVVRGNTGKGLGYGRTLGSWDSRVRVRGVSREDMRDDIIWCSGA